MKKKSVAALVILMLSVLCLTACQDKKPVEQSKVNEVSEVSEVSKAVSEVSETSALSAEDDALAAQFLDEAIKDFEAKKYTQCLVKANDAIAIDKGRIVAYEYKGLAYSYLGEIDLAMDVFDYLIKIHPQPGRASYLKGLCYKCDNDYDNALIWFDKSVTQDPSQTWSWYGAATIYADRNNTDKALDYLEKAIGTDSSIKSLAKKQTFHWSKILDNARFKELTAE